MHILKDSSIVVGLEWTLYESLAEAKKAVAGKKNLLLARRIISGECVQGVCPAGAKARKLQAGALLAAAAASDVLIYHELGDGKAWVCAVREGIPLHGFDLVADEDSAKVTLAEVMSYVPTADIYGDIAGAKGSLNDLFEKVPAAERKHAQLLAPGSALTVILLLVVVLLLLAAGSFFFLLEEQSPAKPSSLSLRNEEEFRRAQQVFAAQVDAERLVFWHARSPGRQFALWYDWLRSLPVSAEGWSAHTIKCTVESCQVTWKRTGSALYSPMARLPGTAVNNESFKPDAKETVTRFDMPQHSLLSYREGAAGTDQFLMDMSVNPGLFKLTLSPSRTVISVNPPPKPEGLTAVPLGQEGNWKLEATNPLILPGFLSQIELPGVTLNSMAITNLSLVRPPYKIELEGRYRVGN